MIECVEVAEGSFLEFFYGATEGAKQQYNHICFEAYDIETLAENLKDKGIDFAAELSAGKDTINSGSETRMVIGSNSWSLTHSHHK